ncbi:MAG: PIN domain-containing protein [Magnetococcales bacterium]|nr:PIN domain-containing protein [Magnetococcales bacterium]
MQTIVVDTNIILRYLLKDHPDFFIRANGFWDKVKQGHYLAFVSEGVLVECVFVLLKVYRVPRQELADVMLAFLETPGLMATDLAILRHALVLFRGHAIDVVDALVVATAQRHDWAVESFDRDVIHHFGRPSPSF